MKKELIKLFLLITITCSISIFIYYNAEKVDEVTYSNDYLKEQNEFEQKLIDDTSYT